MKNENTNAKERKQKQNKNTNLRRNESREKRIKKFRWKNIHFGYNQFVHRCPSIRNGFKRFDYTQIQPYVQRSVYAMVHALKDVMCARKE